MATEPTIYNKNNIYNATIKDLIFQIKKICVLNGIPFVACFAVANNEKGTTIVSDGLPGDGIGISLTDDNFRNILLALNGGQFVSPANLPMTEIGDKYERELSEMEELPEPEISLKEVEDAVDLLNEDCEEPPKKKRGRKSSTTKDKTESKMKSKGEDESIVYDGELNI